ncbi:MAG: 5-formyltetrahydrofolate cyclo-ligase, partial [Clostridia bacterium]|nr:5-formyltetrahydrofolate cyclo-ligase [Clostridia bacterium]
FYDRYLEKHTNHKLVALCYPFQMLEHLETEAHDIPVHMVISAK